MQTAFVVNDRHARPRMDAMVERNAGALRQGGGMEDRHAAFADVHTAAKTAFDSLLIPNGFKRTADWIDADERGHTGREYSRETVRVRLDWDGRGAWLDVRLARVRAGRRRRILGWEDLETIVAGVPSRVRPLTDAEQMARVERLVALAGEVLELRADRGPSSSTHADRTAGA